jgi:hypothetical protein
VAAAAAALVVVLTGCTPSGSPAPSDQVTSSPSAAATPAAIDDARADLDGLVGRLEAYHPEPWHGISREDFVAEAEQLKARLPELSEEETVVEVMRLVALISANGRDGHMFAFPSDGDYGTALPLRVYEFPDGVFVTDALSPYEDLVGREITAVNGHRIADVLYAIDPLVPRDGPATVPAFRPIFFVRLDVLRGLGLVGSGPVEITLGEGSDAETVTLEPVPMAEHGAWVAPSGPHALPVREVRWLSRPDDIFYLEYLPDSRTLYARFRHVRAIAPGLATELEERADDPDVDRVVLDLRHNGGGDNTTYGPLLAAVRSEAVDRAGRLFLLTDRITFSAAANFSTEVEQSTTARFAGEPMGGGLNFWNDTTPVELEHLVVPMTVAVSYRYWQKSTPDDPRLTIDPEIAVHYASADYFADRDPVLEAVLATD